MPRLNDTEALVVQPAEAGMEHSVCVKKIDNGFLTRTSRYNPQTGEYACDEQFSKKPPRITPARVVSEGRKAGSVGAEGLSDTKRYLGKDV